MQRNNRIVIGALIAGILMTVTILVGIVYQLNSAVGTSVAPTTNANDVTTEHLLQLLMANQANQNTRNNTAPSSGAVAAANATRSAPTVTPTVIPTVTAAPTAVPATPTTEVEKDLVISYLPTRAECTVATQLVTQLAESWGYHVHLEQVDSPAELYHSLTQASEHEADITFCYTDPDDRSFFATFVNQISILGNGYYADDELKLYTVTRAGFVAQLDAQDYCLLEFLKGFNDHPILLKGNTVTDFLFEHHEEVAAWGECFGHKGESREEYKARHEDHADEEADSYARD